MPVKTNEGGDEIVSFNEVGADIWMLAENRLTEDEIVVEILKIYGIGSAPGQAHICSRMPLPRL